MFWYNHLSTELSIPHVTVIITCRINLKLPAMEWHNGSSLETVRQTAIISNMSERKEETSSAPSSTNDYKIVRGITGIQERLNVRNREGNGSR